MNKKGEIGDLIWDNAIYLILVVIFFIGMFTFIGLQKNNSGVQGEYYAKEIAKLVDLAEPGDEIIIDVHSATLIASKNGVPTLSEIFIFDNTNNEICVKLSLGRASCYYFFNDIRIVDDKIELGVPGNVLKFKVEEENEDA